MHPKAALLKPGHRLNARPKAALLKPGHRLSAHPKAALFKSGHRLSVHPEGYTLKTWPLAGRAPEGCTHTLCRPSVEQATSAFVYVSFIPYTFRHLISLLFNHYGKHPGKGSLRRSNKGVLYDLQLPACTPVVCWLFRGSDFCKFHCRFNNAD